jgi:hypothetical protein
MVSTIEHALEDCLTRLDSGKSTLEECLALYPDLRSELQPLLAVAANVSELKDFKVDPAFRSRTRTQLQAHMHANPRKKARPFALGFKYAASVAVLALAFATTGTAFAQRALPGDFLYSWKLASEGVWRGLQGDQFQADLTLAERRKAEFALIRGLTSQEAVAIMAYDNIIQQLRADALSNPDHVDTVNQLFLDHQEALRDQFASSLAGLPAIEELLGVIAPSIEEAAPDAAPELPAAGEDEGSISVPAIATAVATAIPKKDRQGNDADSAIDEAIEDESWLEKAIDDLLGLP